MDEIGRAKSADGGQIFIPAKADEMNASHPENIADSTSKGKPMSLYNKLFAAVISTLLMRWMAVYLGLDAESMGVAADLQMAVSLALDAGFAAVNGFFVWLIPNRPKPDTAEPDYSAGQ